MMYQNDTQFMTKVWEIAIGILRSYNLKQNSATSEQTYSYVFYIYSGIAINIFTSTNDLQPNTAI